MGRAICQILPNKKHFNTNLRLHFKKFSEWNIMSKISIKKNEIKVKMK